MDAPLTSPPMHSPSKDLPNIPDLLLGEGVSAAVWVGWSDGAATTLAGLLDSTINAAINKNFVFASFQPYQDTNATFADTSIYQEFLSRCAIECAELQPGANFTEFAIKVGTLEARLPTWSDGDLANIDGSKVKIAGADHVEAVHLAVPENLSSVIAGSRLNIFTGISHFAPMQIPGQFVEVIEEFRSREWCIDIRSPDTVPYSSNECLPSYSAAWTMPNARVSGSMEMLPCLDIVSNGIRSTDRTQRPSRDLD